MFALALTLCLMVEGHPACRVERVYTNDCVEATRIIRGHNPPQARVTSISCVRVDPDIVPRPAAPSPTANRDEETAA